VPERCWPEGQLQESDAAEYEPPVGMHVPGGGTGVTQLAGTESAEGMSSQGPSGAVTETVALFQPVEAPLVSKQFML
jgi:hypothetical protein